MVVHQGPELAGARRRELDIPHDRAEELGRSAVDIAERGYYIGPSGASIDISGAVAEACLGT
jgi:hypothetical protein